MPTPAVKKVTKAEHLSVKWYQLKGGDMSVFPVPGAAIASQLNEYTRVFAPACKKYDPEELKEMLVWAITISDFWPQALTSPEKVIQFLDRDAYDGVKDGLMEKFRGWAQAERNKSRVEVSAAQRFSESVRAVEVLRQQELDAAVAKLGLCKVGLMARHIPYFITGGPKNETCFACHQEAVELRSEIWKKHPLPLRKS